MLYITLNYYIYFIQSIISSVTSQTLDWIKVNLHLLFCCVIPPSIKHMLHYMVLMEIKWHLLYLLLKYLELIFSLLVVNRDLNALDKLSPNVVVRQQVLLY